MNNKTLVGLFVVVFLIVGVVWFVRQRPELFKSLKLPFGTKVTPTVTIAPDQTTIPEVTQTGTNPGTIPAGSVPAGLISCTADVRVQNCNSLEQRPVCGYNKTIASNGAEGMAALTYNTACHYCRFFTDDNSVQVGSSTMTALGYKAGACTQ